MAALAAGALIVLLAADRERRRACACRFGLRLQPSRERRWLHHFDHEGHLAERGAAVFRTHPAIQAGLDRLQVQNGRAAGDGIELAAQGHSECRISEVVINSAMVLPNGSRNSLASVIGVPLSLSYATRHHQRSPTMWMRRSASTGLKLASMVSPCVNSGASLLRGSTMPPPSTKVLMCRFVMRPFALATNASATTPIQTSKPTASITQNSASSRWASVPAPASAEPLPTSALALVGAHISPAAIAVRDRPIAPIFSIDAMKNDDTHITDLLDHLQEAAKQNDAMTLGDILDAAGHRSFGPMLVIPGIVVMSPAGGIPGMATLVGLVCALLCTQVAVGQKRIWLPQQLLQLKLARARFEKIIRFARRPSRWVDRIAKPRLYALLRAPFMQLIAASCVLMGLTMPMLEVVPMADTVPGLAFVLFGLALTTRDGVCALLAAGVSLASLGLVVSVLT